MIGPASELNLDESHADNVIAANKMAVFNSRESDSFMSSAMDFRKLMALVGTFYWFVVTIIVVPTACVTTLFIFLYPILLFSRDVFNRLEHALCRMVNDHWVSTGQFSGLNVTEYGEEIRQYADKRVLFICNHLGLVDHFCLMTAFHDKASLSGRYLWVIYNIWKYTPLGALWTSHGNFFINGGVSKRKAVLQEFQQHLKAKYWRYDYGWVVMYPEGSRLYLIQEAEVKFAEKNGLKPFRYCAHPRAGAAHAVLNICGPQKKSCANDSDQPSIEYIVDCTLGYPNGQVVNLGSAMVGEWPSGNSNVAIHYSIHKVDKSFGNEETLKEWLYKRYEEKDKLLEQFYLTGRFPGPGRQVNFPLSRGLFVQAFWLGLFYFHYHFWMRPLATLIINTSVSLVN